MPTAQCDNGRDYFKRVGHQLHKISLDKRFPFGKTAQLSLSEPNYLMQARLGWHGKGLSICKLGCHI